MRNTRGNQICKSWSLGRCGDSVKARPHCNNARSHQLCLGQHHPDECTEAPSRGSEPSAMTDASAAAAGRPAGSHPLEARACQLEVALQRCVALTHLATTHLTSMVTIIPGCPPRSVPSAPGPSHLRRWHQCQVLCQLIRNCRGCPRCWPSRLRHRRRLHSPRSACHQGRGFRRCGCVGLLPDSRLQQDSASQR